MWINKNILKLLLLLLSFLCFVHLQSQNPKRRITKKHKQKKSKKFCRIDPSIFRDCQWQMNMTFFLTRKDMVGSTRNFREYKINESSFPHPDPGRVLQQVSRLYPDLWMGKTRPKSRLLNQGTAISAIYAALEETTSQKIALTQFSHRHK